MAEKEIQFRKKRELGDIITDSFEFLKQEYNPVSKLVFTYVFPFVLIYGILQVYVQMRVMVNIDFTDQETMLANIGPIYMNVFLSSLFGLFFQSLLAGTYYSYIEIYVKKGKGNFELSEITPLLFSNGLLALGANLVLFIAVMLGVIMCILPGLYIANTLSIVVIILIFEKKRLGDALTRSWNLVNSQWWNTLLINLLGLLIVGAVSFVISIPSMLAGIGSNIFSLQETATTEYPDWYWVLIGTATIVSTIFYVIPYTFLAFQYFNLDERTKISQPPVQHLQD